MLSHSMQIVAIVQSADSKYIVRGLKNAEIDASEGEAGSQTYQNDVSQFSNIKFCRDHVQMEITNRINSLPIRYSG